MKMKIFLFLIVLTLGILLRFYALGVIPTPLNRDEISLGYNAWSVLETGVDEHGQPLRINVESFGDWKLAGYIYASLPAVSLLGPTSFAIRLPSALAGIAVIILVFLITEILLSKIFRFKQSYLVAILAAFLVTISPWAMHFSHVALEAHLAMALFLLGLWSFLYSITANPGSKVFKYKIPILVLSGTSFGLTIFTYHAYQLFTPLFVLGILIYFFSDLKTFSKKSVRTGFISFLLPCFVAGLMLIGFGGTAANSTKFSGLSLFDLGVYTKKVNDIRSDLMEVNAPLLILENKLTIFTETVHRNFWSLMSPTFFFTEGGATANRNTMGIGNFYSFMIIGWLGALFSYARNKNAKLVCFVFVWTLLGFLPGLITSTANHTIRVSPSYVPLTILAAYGFVYWWSEIAKTGFKKLLFLLGVTSGVVVLYAFVFFLKVYFIRTPALGVGNQEWYLPHIATAIQRDYDQVDKVYVSGETESTYMYILQYTNLFTPKTTNLTFKPPTAEGFKHVSQLNNIAIGPIPWEAISKETQTSLIITRSTEVDRTKINDTFYLEEEISHPHSSIIYEVWRHL